MPNSHLPPPAHSDDDLGFDEETRLYALESAFIGLARALIESGVLQTSRLTHHLQAQADDCDRRGIRDSAEHIDLIAQCIDRDELTRVRPATVARPGTV